MRDDETGRIMEEIYRSLSEEEIPWHRAEPPALLKDLIDRGDLRPGRALDIGCGTGSYALYLAAQGFTVTGIDISPSAVQLARDKGWQQGREVEFMVADGAAEELPDRLGRFDLVLEWMILHHILPPWRKHYSRNVKQLLAPGGHYLSVSFSMEDRVFGQPPAGKIRQSPMGPTVYCAPLEEAAALFQPDLQVVAQQVVEIPAKGTARYQANYLLLQKP